jgi:hypothetical protein
MSCCCGAKPADEEDISIKEKFRRIQQMTAQHERILGSLGIVDATAEGADVKHAQVALAPVEHANVFALAGGPSVGEGVAEEEAAASLLVTATSESPITLTPVLSVEPSDKPSSEQPGDDHNDNDGGDDDDDDKEKSGESRPGSQFSMPHAIDKGFDLIHHSALRTQTPEVERDAEEVERRYRSKSRRESAHKKQKALQKRKTFLDFEYDRQRRALDFQKSAAGSDVDTANAMTAKLKQRTEDLANVLQPWKEQLVVMRLTNESERQSYRVSLLFRNDECISNLSRLINLIISLIPTLYLSPSSQSSKRQRNTSKQSSSTRNDFSTNEKRSLLRAKRH